VLPPCAILEKLSRLINLLIASCDLTLRHATGDEDGDTTPVKVKPGNSSRQQLFQTTLLLTHAA